MQGKVARFARVFFQHKVRMHLAERKHCKNVEEYFAPTRSQCLSREQTKTTRQLELASTAGTSRESSDLGAMYCASTRVRMLTRTSKYGHDAVQSRAPPSLSRIREFWADVSWERVTRKEVPSSVRQSNKPDSRSST